MFDTHLSYQERTPNVNVHINQQPNDAADSARLYGELMEKARKEVASATVESVGCDNELKIIQVAHYTDPLQDHVHVRLIFKLNDKLHDITTKNTTWDIREAVYGEVLRVVFENSLDKLVGIERARMGKF